MRLVAIGVFGAVLLSANLAHGQVSPAQTGVISAGQVLTAGAAILQLPKGATTRLTFTAETIRASAGQFILTGRVVMQIDDMRVTADRALVTEDGEIRLEGTVRLERPVK